MFKGGKEKEEQSNSPDKLNRIVEGTQIKGEIKADSNFRIDGLLIGAINTLGKLVVGPTGRIEGDVKCANADIEGEVIGTMKVDNLLTIKASARIEGDIETSKIGIEIGAEFKGVCNYIAQKEEVLISKQVKIDDADNQLVY